MLDYAFIEVLESLTREEIRSLRKFIISPYFNKSEKLVKLFDIIIKYHPNFESPKLTKEALHNKISPQLPYNELTMRSLMHDLQLLIAKFIRQQYIERKEADSKLAVVEELAIRGSERMHSISIRDAEKILDSSKFIDGEYCFNMFRLETEKFYYGMINDRITKKSFVDTEAGKLIKAITYFISYFMLEAIRHNDTLLNYSRSFNVKYNFKFISQFLDLFDFQRLEIFMEKHTLTGINVVKAYINSLKAYLYIENSEYYYKMKSSILDNLDEFSLTDRHFLFNKLSGYCILKRTYLDYNDLEFENELFSIYKILLEKKFYKTDTNKYLPVDLYRNIIIQAAKVKELRWMQEFIEEYSPLIHPNRKEDIIKYSNVYLEFERGNFESALGWLSRIKMEEFTFHLDIRVFYIMVYYELNEFESSFSAARAFTKYLNENKMVSDDKKSSYANLCKFVIKLINFQNSRTKTDPSQLLVQAKKCKSLSSAAWLINKLSILEKKSSKRYQSAG